MSEFQLSAWLGRCQESDDHLSPNLLNRIAATFGVDAPASGAPLPLLWHWCFFQDSVAESALGEDGHPARGGFLPPADNRNRMWAGSRIEFLKSLVVDAKASKRSTILNIEEKQGRTGSLLFVTVLHEYLQQGETVLREEQDIVYREPTPPKLSGTESLPEGEWTKDIFPTSTLLFRYSAATFNSHRIHYDRPYASEKEGYPGLVTHGPLIASLNLHAFIRANQQVRVQYFSFRGVRPLICPDTFTVGGKITSPGKAQVWAGNSAGVAQWGEVEFD